MEQKEVFLWDVVYPKRFIEETKAGKFKLNLINDGMVLIWDLILPKTQKVNNDYLIGLSKKLIGFDMIEGKLVQIDLDEFFERAGKELKKIKKTKKVGSFPLWFFMMVNAISGNSVSLVWKKMAKNENHQHIIMFVSTDEFLVKMIKPFSETGTAKVERLAFLQDLFNDEEEARR